MARIRTHRWGSEPDWVWELRRASDPHYSLNQSMLVLREVYDTISDCMTLGFNGSVEELKEGMTKVMRALKALESTTLDSQHINHNHIRPHQGLNGKTPAQAAGLELHLGTNKWESLIKKASRNT